jgi:hypothetical protein
MAAELGVHPSTITRYEADTALPRDGWIKLWALRTGYPYEWLRYGDGPALPEVVAQPKSTKQRKARGRSSQSSRTPDFGYPGLAA